VHKNTTDIKPPLISCTTGLPSIPGLWQPLSPPYRHEISCVTMRHLPIHDSCSAGSSNRAIEQSKKTARECGRPVDHSGSCAPDFYFLMACKDSPDPIAGSGLAGDAAANFKCLPLCSALPLRRRAFRIGRWCRCRSRRSMAGPFLFPRDRPDHPFWAIECFWRISVGEEEGKHVS
jgi:hypothetical protein